MGAAAAGGAMGGLGVLGSIMGSQAISGGLSDASGLIQAGTGQGISSLKDYYTQAQQYLQPYISQGQQASGTISSLMGLSGTDAQQKAYEAFKSDPSYQYQVSQANQALERGALAKGNLFSGNFMQASNQANQQLASQSFGDYYNRLLGVANQGYSASTGMAGNLTGLGTNIANLYTGQAGSLANIATQQGQNTANMYSGILSSLGAGAGMYKALSA